MTAPARSVVVVGVDGSTGSRDAVRWAAGYARLAGAELRAVASWRWPNYLTRIPPGIDLEADTRRTLQEVTAEIGAEFPGVPIGACPQFGALGAFQASRSKAVRISSRLAPLLADGRILQMSDADQLRLLRCRVQ